MADLAEHPSADPGVLLQLPVDTETLRRLLGEGCIACGTPDGLAPAGHRYTIGGQGGRLGWPVLACPRHLGGAR